MESTIAALATPPGAGGVAIIRLSGSRSGEILSKVFKGTADPVQQPRRACFGTIVTPNEGLLLDTGLALFFRAPHSFTGEDVAEIQFHGSPILAQHILAACFAAGASPAAPGEFSQRGFLNGKMNLAQAEGIADLISATSERAAKLAQEQHQGKLSSVITEIGEPLRDVLAELEALIDFPEEDIEPDSLLTLLARTEASSIVLSALINSFRSGQAIKDGFRVLLCGVPNAGKSSLLNVLLGVNRAIVSPISGTTRDLIEESVMIEGYRFLFCDSAGITESSDPIEKIGVELAKSRLGWADLVLLVHDGSRPFGVVEESLLNEICEANPRVWIILSKDDLRRSDGTERHEHVVMRQKIALLGARSVPLSTVTREGVEELLFALKEELEGLGSVEGEANVRVTSERHLDALRRSFSSLERLKEAAQQGVPLEFLAAEVRYALSALDEIIGKTVQEDILGRIFSKFCIGK